jgi:hypothetical protein
MIFPVRSIRASQKNFPAHGEQPARLPVVLGEIVVGVRQATAMGATVRLLYSAKVSQDSSCVLNN